MSHDEQQRAIEENGQRIAQRLRAAKRAGLEALVAMHPLCPADGLPGSYVGSIYAFGAARIVFECTNQDAFTLNRETGQLRIIPPSDHRFIRRETFELLNDTDAAESAGSSGPEVSAGQVEQPTHDMDMPDAQDESRHGEL